MEETSFQTAFLHDWALPTHGLRLETLDAHVAGQPLRLLLSGFPEPRGATMIERCRFASEHFDHLRNSLLLEPRGHMGMYACLLTPPQRHDSHYGALFMHRSGICPMSGHGIIAITTLAVEAGLIAAKSPETLLKFDTPAGLVRAYARIEQERVARVFFENVPSFVVKLDQEVKPEGMAPVKFDLAYGGEYYAYVNAEDVGISCRPENAHELAQAGIALSELIEQESEIDHPEEPLLSLLGGVVFYEGVPRRRNQSVQPDYRQVCVFTDGTLDRSPSGTAISGRMAIHLARGEIEPGEPIVVEGILGHTFVGKAAAAGFAVGHHPAIIPEIEGRAFLTGRHTLFIDPNDSLAEGFLL